MQTPQGWSRAELEPVVRDNGVDWGIRGETSVDGETWVPLADDLRDVGQVAYQSDRTLHRTAQVTLSRELTWGRDRVRLWYRLTSPHGTFEVPVGTFITSTPEQTAGEIPASWQVECYDLLWLLDDPLGETFVAEAAAGHLETVRALIDGLLPVTLTAEGDGERLLSEDMVFPLDDDLTRLQVINRLLRKVGFRDLWVDGSGRARSEPMSPLTKRGVEWHYDGTADDTEMGSPSRMRDTFDRVNWLKVIPDDPGTLLDSLLLELDDGFPVRRGTVRVEAADSDALSAQAKTEWERARQVEDVISFGVSPNPLHSHRDVVRVTHPDIGADRVKCLVRSWVLPLNGDDMTLELEPVVDEVEPAVVVVV